MPTNQRVLVTGAGGHVGGRLFAHLVAKGLQTRALMRSPQLLPEWAAQAEVVYGDLSDASIRREVLRGVHTVAHLATRGLSAVSLTRTDRAAEHLSTLQLMSDSIRAGVGRFIYISSIHVYGESLVGYVNDETTTSPNTSYGRARRQIEEALLEQPSDSDFQPVIIRLTNSFGVPVFSRPETWKLFMHDLCRQVVLSNAMVLRSDSRVSHDSMALRDVVEVLAQVVTSPQLLQGVYLLASGETMQLAQLAALVQRHAEEVLAISAEVKAPHHQSTVPTSFALDTRRLRDAGIHIPNNRNQEICDLLRYARQEFGQGPS